MRGRDRGREGKKERENMKVKEVKYALLSSYHGKKFNIADILKGFYRHPRTDEPIEELK